MDNDEISKIGLKVLYIFINFGSGPFKLFLKTLLNLIESFKIYVKIVVIDNPLIPDNIDDLIKEKIYHKWFQKDYKVILSVGKLR